MTTKDEILKQRVLIGHKRKKKRPKGWHASKRKKRKASRKARKGKRN